MNLARSTEEAVISPKAHVACGALGGGLLYLTTGSYSAAISFAALHVCMDLDHIPDYLAWGTKPVGIKAFLHDTSLPGWPKVVLFLHGFEWLGLMLMAFAFFPSLSLAGGTAGYAAHLAMDHFGNQARNGRFGTHPLFYFLSFRLWHRFRTNMIMRGTAQYGGQTDQLAKR